MEIKGYIFLPESEVNDPQTVIGWVTNAYEQGGYYQTLGEARSHRKEYENLKDKWVIVPISFVTSEPITD